MKNLARLSFLLAILVGSSALTFAQGFSVEKKKPPSPDSLKGADSFMSLEGRFSIALPQQISGYGPLSEDTPNGRVTYGDAYNWLLEGARFDVLSAEKVKPVADTAEAKALLSRMAEGMKAEVTQKGGKLLSDTEISIAGYPGRELRFESSDASLINRIYFVGSHLYQVTAFFKKDAKLQESVVKILDSFKLLTPEEVNAARAKKAAEAAPAPLPQEPVTKKLKSDAEDEGLKGGVKTVFTEREDLSGTWVVGRRKPSAMDYYNERGNITKRESYDYKGNLFEVSTYGYLDGERAMNDKTVQYEYDPPPIAVAAPSQAKSKYDPRYHYKLRYKYDDKGRLAEEMWYSNNGSLWLRYVYNYKGDEKETLVYDEHGKLNQKYAAKFDAKGNEVEETYYDVNTGKVDEKYSYTYEYDPKGNWMKRTTSKWVEKDGKGQFTPDSVTYRTLTYY